MTSNAAVVFSTTSTTQSTQTTSGTSSSSASVAPLVPYAARISSSSFAVTISNYFKPRRGEAIARLRLNGLSLVIFFVVTTLFPGIPSPLSSVWAVMTGCGDVGSAKKLICWIETLFLMLFSVNIFQAYYALRYPPPPLAPMESPVKKAHAANVNPQSPKPLKPLSPFTQSQTRLQNSTSDSTGLSQRLGFASAGVYPQSPLSTPSRIVNYRPATSSKASSPFGNSFNSSTLSSSSILMSSPLAAYGGRHSQVAVRPVDGSLLNHMHSDDEDE